MKSISDILPAVTASVAKNMVVPNGALALPFRPAPLEADEIDRLGLALTRVAREVKIPKYGSVPVIDALGNAYRHEFDVTGYETNYEIIGPVNQQLLEAIIRPAPKHHVVYHLTRLAIHLRDTRGGAISAVFEDIANDLRGVSEWAIICACKELRLGVAKWFPSTSELTETILRHQRNINRLVEQAKERADV